jgi:hypothetical protein
MSFKLFITLVTFLVILTTSIIADTKGVSTIDFVTSLVKKDKP